MNLKRFIFLVFLIHLFDSLYIRSHGDALNYHLYAPYNWARFGILHVNTFQSTHFQGAWYEFLIWILFKIYLPETTEAREFILKVFQVGSCALAYLAVPLVLYKNAKARMSSSGVWLVICAYYACEMALFTMQFAKNDAWAMTSFIVGVFAATPVGVVLGLGVASGIKTTYLLASLCVIAVGYKSRELKKTFLMGLGILFFPAVVWIRNYLATGSWVFPLPSDRGLQTSQWLKEYFQQFTVPAPEALTNRLGELIRFTPLYAILLVIAITFVFAKKKSKLKKPETALILLPMLYLLTTGYLLEWRTFAGVLFVSVFYLILFIDQNWKWKKGVVFTILCFLGLASSKIDLASVTRFTSAKDKHFYELNRDGAVFQRANEVLTKDDIVLTLLTNEGFFLVPQIYTVNEHPAREEILKKFPLLEPHSQFIGIRSEVPCLGGGQNENFVDALLEKSQADLVQDEVQKNLYWLNVKCRRSS